jgi:hypothetical protein
MHTTPEGGRVARDGSIRGRDERALARLPLRQRWRVLCGQAESPSPLHLLEAGSSGSNLAIFAQGSGGEICALHERALGQGRQAVRHAHRGAVTFDQPTVHTYLDPLRKIPLVPLMFVKVDVRGEHLDAVMQMLRARGARLHEVELQGRRAVLRAEIPLAALLGFEDAVLSITVRSAQVFTWLVRYDLDPRSGSATSCKE